MNARVWSGAGVAVSILTLSWIPPGFEWSKPIGKYVWSPILGWASQFWTIPLLLSKKFEELRQFNRDQPRNEAPELRYTSWLIKTGRNLSRGHASSICDRVWRGTAWNQRHLGFLQYWNFKIGAKSVGEPCEEIALIDRYEGIVGVLSALLGVWNHHGKL